MFNWLYSALRAFFLAFFMILQAWGGAVINGILDGIGGVFPALNVTGAQAYLANINYLFPLYETVSYCTVLFALWLVVLVYRIVKSWIPTVSGT